MAAVSSDGTPQELVSTPFAMSAAMPAADGNREPVKSHTPSRQIYATAVFDAHNTGYRADPAKVRAGESNGWDAGWSNLLAATIVDRGTALVIVDPAG